MQEINLLQTRSKILSTNHAWEKQSKLLVTLLSIILVIFLVGGGGLMALSKSVTGQTIEVENSNTKLQTELFDKEGSLDEAKIFQAQLTNLNTLISRHVYISALLDEIESMTFQRARYISVNAGNDGVIHLQGRAASYVDLGKLLLGLTTSDQFSNVRLLSAAPSNDESNAYAFSIDLTANPGIFIKK